MNVKKALDLLAHIASAERDEGVEKLKKIGAIIKGNTIEDVIDGIPSDAGSATKAYPYSDNEPIEDTETS